MHSDKPPKAGGYPKSEGSIRGFKNERMGERICALRTLTQIRPDEHGHEDNPDKEEGQVSRALNTRIIVSGQSTMGQTYDRHFRVMLKQLDIGRMISAC